MPRTQTRRRFLTTLSLAGAAGLLGAPAAAAAEDALETTREESRARSGIRDHVGVS